MSARWLSMPPRSTSAKKIVEQQVLATAHCSTKLVRQKTVSFTVALQMQAIFKRKNLFWVRTCHPVGVAEKIGRTPYPLWCVQEKTTTRRTLLFFIL